MRFRRSQEHASHSGVRDSTGYLQLQGWGHCDVSSARKFLRPRTQSACRELGKLTPVPSSCKFLVGKRMLRVNRVGTNSRGIRNICLGVGTVCLPSSRHQQWVMLAGRTC